MAVAGMKRINVLVTKVCLQLHKSPSNMNHHSSMTANNLYFILNLLDYIVTLGILAAIKINYYQK